METSHMPTLQDNCGAFLATMPLFKAREEMSHKGRVDENQEDKLD
jgi:hypothetical protein